MRHERTNEISEAINFFFFQAEDGIRDYKVTGVQTCALPISQAPRFILAPRVAKFRRNRNISSHAVTSDFRPLRARLLILFVKIGRASCRERVLYLFGAVCCKSDVDV